MFNFYVYSVMQLCCGDVNNKPFLNLNFFANVTEVKQ